MSTKKQPVTNETETPVQPVLQGEDYADLGAELTDHQIAGALDETPNEATEAEQIDPFNIEGPVGDLTEAEFAELLESNIPATVMVGELFGATAQEVIALEESTVEATVIPITPNGPTEETQITVVATNEKTGFLSAISSIGNKIEKTQYGTPTMKLEDLERRVMLAAANQRDTRPIIRTIEMELADNGILRLTSGHSFTQLGLQSAWEWLGLPSSVLAFFQGKSDLKAIVKHFNMAARDKRQDEPATIRFRKRVNQDGTPMLNKQGEQIETVRAIRGAGFVVVDNPVAMQLAKMALIEHCGETLDTVGQVMVSQFYHDGDRLSASFLPPAYRKKRADSEYCIGFAVRNDETGGLPLSGNGFLYRNACDNGLVWGQKKIKDADAVFVQRHTGKLPTIEEMSLGFSRMALASLKNGGLLMEQFDIAREVVVNYPDAVLVEMASRYDLSQEIGQQWHEGLKVTLAEEGLTTEDKGKTTYFHLINGLTNAARFHEGSKQIDMQQTAADMLAETLQDGIDQMKARVARWENLGTNGLTQQYIDGYLNNAVVANQTAGIAA